MLVFLSICLAIFLLNPLRVESQLPPASWSHAFGDTNNQMPPSGVAMDSNGNVFLVGYFEDEIDLGGGPLVNPGKDDVYLAKYDSGGNHLWSQSFGDNTWQMGYDVATDPVGNVIIVGGFTNTVDFGGDLLISTGPAFQDIFDIFIAKFDPDGNHIWSRSFGGNGDDSANTLCVDGSGEITIAGTYMQPFSIDGSPMPDFGSRDFFVAAFTEDGTHKWSWGMGGSATDICGDIVLDQVGNLLVAGCFAETVDFGDGPVTSPDGRDVFLAKYDQNGAHLWSRQYVVTEDNVGGWEIGVCSCDDGSVYLSGFFSNQIDLGYGVLTSASRDVYLAKVDQNGATLWSRAYGDTNGQAIYGGIATFGGSDVIMTGDFAGEIDFGSGPLVSAGSADVFLVRLDQTGTQVQAQAFGDAAPQTGWSVTTGPAGELVVTGYFSGSIDFGNGSLTSAGENDIFMARFDLPVSAVDIVAGRFGAKLSTHPNPFNPCTTISFECGKPGPVQLAVHDLAGRRVALLIDGWLGTGHHEKAWDGCDFTGKLVASGQYLVRLWTSDGVDVQKVILAK